MNTRNEIKAIIVREGMTMSEVVEKMAEQYAWSASVESPTFRGSCGAARCVTMRPSSWLTRWAKPDNMPGSGLDGKLIFAAFIIF